MVLPLRLATLSVLVVGCTTTKPGTDSEQPDTQAVTGVAPIEAEPNDGPDDPVEPALADETVEIDGVTLGLVAADCGLTAEFGDQRLVHRFEFPAACSFATDSPGAVRVVATEAGRAVMVESSKPLDRDCDTATRVVVITPQGPRVSKAVQRVAMCAPFAWDEMMFHVLASEPVAFGTPGVAP